MGVLYDYFRASDDEAVIKPMDATGGDSVLRYVGGGDSPAVEISHPVAEVVEAKGIDPAVVLGMVVSFALDVPWDPEPIGERLIWPQDAAENPELEPPLVVALGERARDALADIPDDRIAELADRWSRIEEAPFYADQPGVMQSLLREFVGLARRARASGERLYCWMCF